MVDKISNWPGAQPSRRTESPARSAPAGSDRSAGAASDSAAAASAAPARATLLAQARARIDAAPAVDQGRVDAIKGAISRGEFKIDTQAVAKAFMAMESDL